MTGKYATDTKVSAESSRAEIERTLERYGADAFGYTRDGRIATVAFRMQDRHYRFRLTLPDPKDEQFWLYLRGSVKYRREDHIAAEKWEQACRSSWRALALVVKAKLEAVAAGISTVEDEFLAHMVLPENVTVGEWMKPQIEEAYRIGSMPRRLMLEGPQS